MKPTWISASLPQLLAQIWHALENAPAEVKDPFRLPAVATAAQSGGRVRVVVLREASRAERKLVCYSDVRAAKIAQLRRDPSVEWLFFDPNEGVQIRATGAARLHFQDAVCKEAWAKSPPAHQHLYVSGVAPGTRIQKRTPFQTDSGRRIKPSETEIAQAYLNFAVIVTTIQRLDWLRTSLTENRRAAFAWRRNRFQGSWLEP